MQIQIQITDINTNKTVNVCGKCTCTYVINVVKYSVQCNIDSTEESTDEHEKSADRDYNAVHHDFKLSNPKSKKYKLNEIYCTIGRPHLHY